MIISHQYKFIFLKTNKTAGTSVEIALSKFCGPADVITPISPADEQMRKDLGYKGGQNYYVPLSNYSARNLVSMLVKGRKKRFYNHIPAVSVKELVGEEIWNDYYKFCIERNPWDRAVSLYYYQNRKDPGQSISEFIDAGGLSILKDRGFCVYTIDGKIAVDRVCRFEMLGSELESVRTLLGLPEKLELPRAKGAYRKDKRRYNDILSQRDVGRVAALFQEEIELFGYECEPATERIT